MLGIPCVELDHVSEQARAAIAAMPAFMSGCNGVGLAAPQVGWNVRVAVCSLDHPELVSVEGGTEDDVTFIGRLLLLNPVILRGMAEDATDTEGCLSIPRTKRLKRRFRSVWVQTGTLDDPRARITVHATRLLARIIQHEVDHLDGLLITDERKGM